MIIKETFRNQVREILYKQLLSATIHPGDKISLAALSRELNTSVTPIREALTQLEHSGIIEAIPNVGFCVKELTKEEAKQVYEVIGVLEELALQQTDPASINLIKLRKISGQISNETDARKRIHLDNQFHELLIINSKNQKAVTLLKNLKLSVYIYELEFMDRAEMNNLSDESHEKLLDLIEQNQIKEAALKLREHWNLSYQLIKHLQS